MSQLALYRKWRPQRFAEMVGQAHIARILLNALRQDRLTHAYLFCGPRGTGKTTSARLLAKALNCQQPVDAEPCNQCQSCLEITAGHSLDVIEIDAASNRGIDSARDLREQVRFAASGGRYRVFIIDEFHMLTKEAFNALLKTLEEPPERVIFVLATTEPHEVLPTILSRCQRFDFQRIASREMAEHLRAVAEAEQIAVSDAVIEALARKANGGLRDGLSLLDQVRALGMPGETLPDALVYQVLGLVQEEALLQLLQAGFSGDLETLLRILQHLLEQGHDPHQIVQELLQLLRHLSLAALPPEALENLGVPSHLLVPIQNLGQQLSRGAVVSAIEHLLRCSDRLHHCAQPEIWLEADLMAFALQAEPALLERVERLEQGTVTAARSTPRPVAPAADTARPAVSDSTSAYQVHPEPRPPASPLTRPESPLPSAKATPTAVAPAKAVPPPQSEPLTGASEPVALPVDPNDLKGLWQALLSKLKLKAPLLYGFVAVGRLQQVQAASQTWIIAYAEDKEAMMRQLQPRLKDGKLQGLVSELMGSSYNVQLVSANPTQPASAAHQTTASSLEAVSALPPTVSTEGPGSASVAPTVQPTPSLPADSMPSPSASQLAVSPAVMPSAEVLTSANEDAIYDDIDMDFMPEERVSSEPMPAQPVSPAIAEKLAPPSRPAVSAQSVSSAVAQPEPSTPMAKAAQSPASVTPAPDESVQAPSEQAHLQEIADLFKGKVIRKQI